MNIFGQVWTINRLRFCNNYIISTEEGWFSYSCSTWPIRDRVAQAARWGGTSHQTLWAPIGGGALSPWPCSQSEASVDVTSLRGRKRRTLLSRIPAAAATAPASQRQRRFDGGHLGRLQQQHQQQPRQTVVATSPTTWTSWSHWATRRRYSTCSSSKWGAVLPSCQSWIMWVTAAACF